MRVSILRVMDRLVVGGPSLNVVYLSQFFGSEGPQSDQAGRWETVLVVGREGSREGSLLDFARQRGVEPVRLPSLGKDLSPGRDISAFWRLCRLIKSQRPQILHTHKSKAGALGRMAGWACRVPVRVHTFHGHVLHGYFGRAKSFAFILIERALALVSDRIIAVSPKVKEDLLRYRIAPAHKIEVIPLGLDLEKFRSKARKEGTLRKELGLEPGQPTVGIVARLVPIKEIPVFLGAARIVLGRHPEARFVIVGDGELRQELEDLADRLGLRPSTHFLGFRSDLENIYPDLDILTLTSRNEGSPVSLIEGLASGCAVVAADVGGVGDVVRDGETGLLVPPESPEALAQAVSMLIEHPRRRRELGEAGRADVLKRFPLDRMIRDMRALYLRLLSEKGAGPGCASVEIQN